MAMSVQNNVSAMNAYRNLSQTQNDLGSSLEKLSSGFRVSAQIGWNGLGPPHATLASSVSR